VEPIAWAAAICHAAPAAAAHSAAALEDSADPRRAMRASAVRRVSGLNAAVARAVVSTGAAAAMAAAVQRIPDTQVHREETRAPRPQPVLLPVLSTGGRGHREVPPDQGLMTVGESVPIKFPFFSHIFRPANIVPNWHSIFPGNRCNLRCVFPLQRSGKAGRCAFKH